MKLKIHANTVVNVVLLTVLGQGWMVFAQTETNLPPSQANLTNLSATVSNPPAAKPRSRRSLPPQLPVVERVMTEEQRAVYRDALRVNRKKMEDLQVQLREAEWKVFETILAEKFDEALFSQRAAVVEKIRTETVRLNARAFLKVRPTMTPEQVERLRILESPVRLTPSQTGESVTNNPSPPAVEKQATPATNALPQ